MGQDKISTLDFMGRFMNREIGRQMSLHQMEEINCEPSTADS